MLSRLIMPDLYTLSSAVQIIGHYPRCRKSYFTYFITIGFFLSVISVSLAGSRRHRDGRYFRHRRLPPFFPVAQQH